LGEVDTGVPAGSDTIFGGSGKDFKEEVNFGN
jgi:hypothetical protein